jgi:Cu/Ag efflux protein CusF
MKLRHAWIAGLFTLSTTLVQAAEVNAGVDVAPGQASLAQELTASATVTAIDLETRKVSLKNTEGETFDIVAGEQVANLPNVKVGDKIMLKYLQILDVELLKGTAGIRKRIVEVDGERAGADEKPGGGVGMKVTIYADVIGLDKQQQTVTVRGVDETLTIKINNPEQFNLIAEGDQLKAVQTKAIGIGIVASE